MILDRITPPPVSRVKSIILPPAQNTSLGNGLKVVYFHDPTLEITRFALISSGGTADVDNPAVPWVASRVSAEGTAGMSGTEIAELIDANGAWMSNSVAHHHTTTTFFTLPSRIDRVLPVMADILFHPVYPEKEIELAVSKGIANARMREATTRYQSALLSNRSTFGSGHPMARPASVEYMEAVTRDSVLSFHNLFSSPAAKTLFVTGNITPEVEKAVEHHFGQLPANTFIHPERIPFSPAAPGLRSVRVPHSRQSSVSMTLPAVPRSHADYVPLRLTLMALGGYFGSRLSQRIREELGLTYGISAALLGYEEGGIAQISTECNSEAVEQLIDETRAEIRRLITDPPGAEELSRVSQAETTALLECVETPFAVTEFYQVLHTTGLSEAYFYDRLQIALTITSDDISRLASTYLDPDRLIISVATP